MQSQRNRWAELFFLQEKGEKYEKLILRESEMLERGGGGIGTNGRGRN